MKRLALYIKEEKFDILLKFQPSDLTDEYVGKYSSWVAKQQEEHNSQQN